MDIMMIGRPIDEHKSEHYYGKKESNSNDTRRRKKQPMLFLNRPMSRNNNQQKKATTKYWPNTLSTHKSKHIHLAHTTTITNSIVWMIFIYLIHFVSFHFVFHLLLFQFELVYLIYPLNVYDTTRRSCI